MDSQLALLWILNGSSLLEIGRKARMKFPDIKNAADRLLATDLLKDKPKRKRIPNPVFKLCHDN